MSRCFPYLAASRGGASAVALDESLIESIKLQKEKERQKEKEERKKEKKRERKEKKARSREDDGSLEPPEPSRKKRKHNEEKQLKQNEGHQKGREDAAEQLEGSSVTEENGPPASIQNLYDSDRSQNSNHNENPVLVTIPRPNCKGLVVRFKLPLLKHTDIKGPQNLKDTEPTSSIEEPCFSGRITTPCRQQASGTVKHAISSKKTFTESAIAQLHRKQDAARTADKPLSFNPRRIQAVSTGTTGRQAAAGTAGKTSTSHQKFIPTPRAETVCKHVAVAPETPVKPSSSHQRGILPSRLEQPLKREANGVSHKPSCTSQRHNPTAIVETPHKQETADAALKSSSYRERQISTSAVKTPCKQHGDESTEKPSSSLQSCLPADKPSSSRHFSRSSTEAAQTDDRPSNTNQTHTPPGKVEPPSKQAAASATTSDKSSGSHHRRSRSERKEQQFKDLVNWKPPPLQWECSDNDCEQSWLCETREQQGDAPVARGNTCKSGFEGSLGCGNADGSYQVRACYVPEVDMFVMPFAIPY